MSPEANIGGASSGVEAEGFRYWLGIALLVVSVILPILALIFVPLLGFPEDVNSVVFALSLVGGPELLLALAVATLGQENVDRILGTVAPWFKRLVRWDDVTRKRYAFGLWVLSVSIAVPLVVTLFLDDSVVGSDGQPGWGFYVLIGSTYLFFVAFFIMGAPLWQRIRALFTWDADITFPLVDE